jgi:hypothetical protein
MQLLNDIWNAGRMTEEWKEAVISNIHKGADRSVCTNNAHIFLLNLAYKIYMTIWKAKLHSDSRKHSKRGIVWLP